MIVDGTRRSRRSYVVVVNQIYARATLSQRETEVLRLLGDGKATAEIAAKLKISLKTVNEYCARLKRKLDAPTHSCYLCERWLATPEPRRRWVKLFRLFLAESLESGITAQRVPLGIEPEKRRRNGHPAVTARI